MVEAIEAAGIEVAEIEAEEDSEAKAQVGEGVGRSGRPGSASRSCLSDLCYRLVATEKAHLAIRYPCDASSSYSFNAQVSASIVVSSISPAPVSRRLTTRSPIRDLCCPPSIPRSSILETLIRRAPTRSFFLASLYCQINPRGSSLTPPATVSSSSRPRKCTRSARC